MPRRPTLSLAASAVLLAALTLGSCGGEDETPAVCSSVDALKTSVTDLQDVKIDKNALTTLQDSFNQIKSDLTKLTSDAEDEFATEVDAVTKAASSVSSSLEAAAAPTAATVTAVGVAIESLGTSLRALEEAVRSTC